VDITHNQQTNKTSKIDLQQCSKTQKHTTLKFLQHGEEILEFFSLIMKKVTTWMMM
jgi:hypothetical protein